MEPESAPPTDTETIAPTAPVAPSAAPQPDPSPPVTESPAAVEHPVVPVKPDPISHAPAPAKPPKSRSDNVTAAIIATVVIVLGLAVLAVFAFLKSK